MIGFLKNKKKRRQAIDLAGFEIAGMGNWSYCPTDKRYRCSRESCRLRGFDLNEETLEVTYDKWWEGVHEADRQQLESGLGHLQDARVDEISVHYRIRRKDGQWRWLLTRASVGGGVAGVRPALIRGVDIDVTEIHEERPANRLLRNEAERAEIALASSNQGLWQIDFRLGLRLESDTWKTMRGYPADSGYCSGTDFYNDLHPDDLAMVKNHQKFRVEPRSDIIDYTYRQRHANGHWMWIWSRGKILERDKEGKPQVMIGTDTDITDIKEAEARFERLSNTLDIAIQAAGMGVWEWSLNAHANVRNSRTREIFGTDCSTNHITRKEFLSMVYPDDRAKVERVLEAALKKPGDISIDYRIVHPQRGVRYIKAKAKSLVVVGKAPRYVGIVWDVTDTVNAERERITLAESLSHAQRLQSIGELTGGIAHDFNNLLAIIGGNAELMSMTQGEENTFLKAIMSASERGSALIKGLLAFSRKQSLSPKSVNMAELVRNLFVLLDRTLGPSIRIETRTAPELWGCKADPVQLENALINLVVNARDAMPKGGVISLSMENSTLDSSFTSLAQKAVPGEFVKVSVTDSGTGMTKEALQKSVDPYFTTKPAGEGHGLGLSMVFGFINQSNGHITIDSEENKGTTVSLYIPRYSDASSEETHCEQSVDNQALLRNAGGGERIMLVEDNLAVREMIKSTMEHLGYNPVCVGSAAEAFETMSHNDQSFALVITDVVLANGMNGFELGCELRNRFPSTKILYISGYAQDALRKQGSAADSIEILQKPFSVETLAARISELLPSKNPGLAGRETHETKVS